MIPIPCIEHGLSGVVGYRAGLMEGRLSVVCFACRMSVQRLKIDGAS